MSSFLDESYLGGLGNTDITTAPTVQAEAPAQQVARRTDTVTLPGGIVMPKQTFYLLAVVVVAAAVYLYTKRKKAD